MFGPASPTCASPAAAKSAGVPAVFPVGSVPGGGVFGAGVPAVFPVGSVPPTVLGVPSGLFVAPYCLSHDT